MEAFNDPEFIALIEEIKNKAPDKFMELVLTALKAFPDYAVEDNVPMETKASALAIVLKHFEEREDYEDCAFIRDLQKRIEDAEEG
jgi:hypothetical protein